jgi:cyanophycinase-like exopeptidase
MITECHPGPIVLFGSGETSASGRKIFEQVIRYLPHAPKISLIETPAGFELNTAQVIGRVGDFLQRRLINYAPRIQIIPARKRGTAFSPDDAQLAEPILESDIIFMGPGSPTYAVRQLRDSVTWHYLIARHSLGATLVLASAATIAFSAYALPVYEIYKVGDELHWKAGLDFFSLYGFSLIFIPHWNNNEGGDELDTNRCFMGKRRFIELVEQLPAGFSIIGIDEKTALVINPSTGSCQVMGLGGVTLYRSDSASKYYLHGEGFTLEKNNSGNNPLADYGIPNEVLIRAKEINQQLHDQKSVEGYVPEHIIKIAEAREVARKNKDWRLSDQIREQLEEAGWKISDTVQGPLVTKRK